MNILVIGCDQVGASLVRDLEHIGHDISLIEKDPEQLKRLDAFDDYRFRGTALVGDPTDPDTLRQGGIDHDLQAAEAGAVGQLQEGAVLGFALGAHPPAPGQAGARGFGGEDVEEAFLHRASWTRRPRPARP